MFKLQKITFNLVAITTAVLCAILVLLITFKIPGNFQSSGHKKTPDTVESIFRLYSSDVEKRLKPWFVKAGVHYPPKKISMLAFKKEQRFELWALHSSKWVFIKNYPFTATSGVLGPKLREGDKQIPEGVYKISGLNPNSSYHLSMKLNYPNEFDLTYARKEGRHKPGTNIFIHGRAASVGCIALGDIAIEELFVLVSVIRQSDPVGKAEVSVIVAPWDFRKRAPKMTAISKRVRKAWLKGLYQSINDKLKDYPLPKLTTGR